MILINLLPHREVRRQERKRAFFSALALAGLVGMALVVVWYAVIQQLASAQQARNRFLSAEIQTLDTQIKDIASLKSDIDGLKARQQAVEDLQTDRNVPVYLLNELVKQTPEGVYLIAIRQADNIVTVSGLSQTNERVSEMLRNTAYNSPWLERPELIEIKAAPTQGRDPRRLFDFSMRLSIKRPQSILGAASGASAPKTPSAVKGS